MAAFASEIEYVTVDDLMVAAKDKGEAPFLVLSDGIEAVSYTHLEVYKRQVYRSENAGMSSANAVRICMAESLRFLEEGSSAPG